MSSGWRMMKLRE